MPADDVSLGGHRVTHLEESFGARLGAELLDPAGELVADGERGLETAAGPGIPLPDVEIGSADSGGVDPNEHVAGTAPGRRHVAELHARAGTGFDYSAHRRSGGRGISKKTPARASAH